MRSMNKATNQFRRVETMMPKSYILVSVVLLATFQILFAQCDSSTDPLVRVLQAKGVLTEAEARSITANASTAEQRDRLAVLLRDKGVISPAEFTALRTNASSPTPRTITADYKTTSPYPAATAQPTPAKVIAAIAPTRLLGI